MDKDESVLEAIYEEDNLDDEDPDVEMLDVEEGEFVGENLQAELGQSSGGDVNAVNPESRGGNRRRRKNKRNRKRRSGLALNYTDINRFVLDTCRHLKEKKSYMVYTAVGCLGVSALSDLVKEVDAIQACGGQMTADGRRHRTGGGILWSIIKAREPMTYQEIMKRAKEFEKQFRHQNTRKIPEHNIGTASQKIAHASSDQTTVSISDGSQLIPQIQSHHEQPSAEGKRVSVHDRIRVPIRYDDLVEEDPKDDPS